MQERNQKTAAFLRTSDRKIVDGEGKTVILRGWGHADWMNPEPFTLGIPMKPFGMGLKENEKYKEPSRFDRAREMNYAIRELCGTEYAKKFWPRWMRAQLGEADIKAMAQLGYNSVRLPLNAWHLMPEEPEICFCEESFEIIKEVLDWCEKYQVYAILDLHAAPGGQSGIGCDDGIDDRAHMFTEPESRERTIRMWEEIAERFCDRTIIAGFDLLNEPLSGRGMMRRRKELADFYDELIPRIRQKDPNHILMLEGTGFSNDLGIFDHEYDPEYKNWCIATHYYHFSPEIRELYRFIYISRQWNVPVWIGEGGASALENSVYYELAADFYMGYALWSWKGAKNAQGFGMGTLTRPLPRDWNVICEYIEAGGPRPAYQKAQEIFDELIELSKYQYCTTDEKEHRLNTRRAGITLPAAGYDQGEEDEQLFHGTWKLGNAFGYRSEDHMKLILRDGMSIPEKVSMHGEDAFADGKSGLDKLWLELSEGEYVSYTIRENCSVSVRAKADQQAVLRVSWGKEEHCLALNSGSMDSYEIGKLDCAEEEKVRLYCEAGCAVIESVTFAKV